MIGKSLQTPTRIRSLQRKLYRKAKAEPAYRFYMLYDKVCREDILRHAYALARSNAGAPGVDAVTFADIDLSGREAWLAGLREELVSKTYRPNPVRRVSIPKPNGGERPPHTRRTALLANQPLGSAEVTHPFHPRRGQRFVVLKVRRVSGVETLSLRHVELGSFAVPREWTDWAPLDAQAAPTGGQPLLIDAFGLSALTELVTLLTGNGGLDR